MPHLVLYAGLPPSQLFRANPSLQGVRSKRSQQDRDSGKRCPDRDE